MQRGFELVINKKNDEAIALLPIRGTKTSAGYDFFTPIDIVIRPQENALIWTDVKAYMNAGEVLLLDVRSSIGIKQDLMLSNTLGVIDSDYYNNVSNEGNIGISIRNLKPKFSLIGINNLYTGIKGVMPIPIIKDLTEENTVIIKAGERVAQGIFVSFLPADNCNSEIERKGGIGSTNK